MDHNSLFPSITLQMFLSAFFPTVLLLFCSCSVKVHSQAVYSKKKPFQQLAFTLAPNPMTPPQGMDRGRHPGELCTAFRLPGQQQKTDACKIHKHKSSCWLLSLSIESDINPMVMCWLSRHCDNKSTL